MSESESTVLPLGAKELDITKIPELMYKYDWVYSKILMERWLSQPANNNPEIGHPSTDLIKMDWVLSFPRAQMVYRKLMQEQVWVNSEAQKQIMVMLMRNNLLGDKAHRFGTPKLGLPFADKNSIQYRGVGTSLIDMAFEDLDDLKGSLARFNLKVIVIGEVAPILNEKKLPTKRYKVTIDEIGVYVKDSYDFNDKPVRNQYLGNWNFKGESIGKTLLNGGFSVFNSDFRKWREETGRGGDFLIFSDIRYTKINPANVFEFSL